MASVIDSWTQAAAISMTKIRAPGEDRLLLVVYAGEGTGSIALTSVTYGDQTCTSIYSELVGTITLNILGAAYLTEDKIQIASSNTLATNYSTVPSTGVDMCAAFLGGVNQATPIGAKDIIETLTNGATLATAGTTATTNGDLAYCAAVSSSSASVLTFTDYTKVVTNTGSWDQFDLGQATGTGVALQPSVAISNTGNRAILMGFVVKEMTNRVKNILSWCSV